MKRSATALATLLAAITASVPGPSFAASTDLALEVEHLFVGDGTSLNHVLILIHDGKIVSVETGKNAPAGVDVRKAAYAMPGLVDIHAHYCYQETSGTRGSFASVVGKRTLDRWDPACPIVQPALLGG